MENKFHGGHSEFTHRHPALTHRHPALVAGTQIEIFRSAQDDEIRNKGVLIDPTTESGMTRKCAFTLSEGATHVDMFYKDCRVAFTLAEVLITLGIIGIVAALTIPTLVTNQQTKAYNTASAVFERKIEEATRVMNTEQTLAGYTNTKDFVQELSKHIKITKICETVTDCFAEKVIWGVPDLEEIDIRTIETSKDIGKRDWNTQTLGLQFANGTTGITAYNPKCRQNPYSNQITGSSCLALVYDTNGNTKPNTKGKDLRAINGRLGKCAFKLNGTCYDTPFFPTPATLVECNQMKSRGEVNNCLYDNDYWAGAVKQCGGKGNMPTQVQLTDIASIIYDTRVSSSGQTIAKRNDTVVASFGFKINNGDSFGVWSGQEYSQDFVYLRNFYPTATEYYYNKREIDSYQAICLVD